jgi:hypothetical protein
MLTARDYEIVQWIGRVGGATAGHTMLRFGMGRTAAYRRLAQATQDGLLDSVQLLYGEPTIYVPTRRGLRWTGLGHLPTGGLSPATVAHTLACTRVWLELEAEGAAVIGERELRSSETAADHPFASVDLPVAYDGRPRRHRPDMAVYPGGTELPVAIEVELSVKAARRLDLICRAWGRARHLAGVRYYAPPPVARAVANAVARTGTEGIVEIRPLPPTHLDRPEGISSCR